ncbi:hypothetical protein ENSA5_09920 [Enhygromyxa salina]|uniref:Uncharacterized protein n=1 Tax=Enhygromyxa salina TaxID=215803 RepID=A0A2S9YGH6_9BACT|nr:hypothetical protein ENSA5_09920 [Enhygromyxa salina]
MHCTTRLTAVTTTRPAARGAANVAETELSGDADANFYGALRIAPDTLPYTLPYNPQG